ncbi:class I SAM-dependent methyltransferase [Parerythrobacter aestuarii]|uniref:hypothetical protein n=1 Tax=Parerythrobacter aestuarii TaxID=3020909 RepID=UPI0024DE8ED3|nr:hypothetical protein [Parerythrobacter aestuarii]
MPADFETVVGKKSSSLDEDWLRQRAEDYSGVALDIGTGDGRFVIAAAREEPDWLWIGLDPVKENMAKSARTAQSSIKRGGVPNAIFIRGTAEMLPGPFAGLADRITINYPWGSLLKIVSIPQKTLLERIKGCGKQGARVDIYLNYSTFTDPEYLDRLGFSESTDPATDPSLLETYVEAGFARPERTLFSGDPPFKSQWGRQLVRGADRQSLHLSTRILAN